MKGWSYEIFSPHEDGYGSTRTHHPLISFIHLKNSVGELIKVSLTSCGAQLGINKPRLVGNLCLYI